MNRIGRVVSKIWVLALVAAVGCASGSQSNNIHGSVPVNVSSLTDNGMSLITDAAKPDGSPILIVRQKQGVYAAFSMRCPMDGCTLTQLNDSTIYCPCDKSKFNMQGIVTSGVVKSPLKEYITNATTAGQTINVQF